MAWKTIFDDSVSFRRNYGNEPFGGPADDCIENASRYNKLRLTIEGYSSVELPKIGSDDYANYFGGYKEAADGSHYERDYTIYKEAAYAVNSSNSVYVYFYDDKYYEKDAYYLQLSVKIEVETNDPTPSKKSTTLGVKEAMQHFIKSIDESLTPATTIKKLTKQMLDPLGEVEAIQKARTIADIWEQSAIANGYEPDEGGTEEGTEGGTVGK